MRRYPALHSMFAVTGVIAVISCLTIPSMAYDKYTDGCDDCHGDFDGPVSPAGTLFPNDSKHTMHIGSQFMDTDCSLCHVSIGDSPQIGVSGGTANNPGVGCVGCHGRDYGGTLGDSGVGLRLHHANNGVTFCGGCHPGDPEPLPENVLPTYYGTPDTNADDPCNAGPDFLENWSIGDTVGLDNDGDNLYDQDDDDCAAACFGDLNDDGNVDGADLGLLLGNWGGGGTGDLNDDGMVDGADLGLLLGAWGPC